MIYCILAATPGTAQIGVGVASGSVAGGYSHVHMAGGVGARVRLGPREALRRCLVMELMALGLAPQGALGRALKDDADATQLLVILDRMGHAAVHMAPDAPGWAGERSGNGFICAGVGLSSAATVEAMAEAFSASDGLELDLRLLKALEAGSAAGGMAVDDKAVPARSAALMVHGAGVHSEADLRVDLHDDAVARLRALYDFHKPYEAFYRLRSENPRQTPPQEAFMRTIPTQPLKETT